MAYTLPQARIFQLTRQTASPAERRPYACLLGGNAQLYRYADADEKLLILLGSYDPVGALVDGDWKTCYDWPNKPVGSTLEPTFTKLYVDNGLLRYFRDTTHTITRVGSNKLRHPTKNFATNGGNAHSADFLDRGVKVGDIVTVKATVDAVDYTLLSYVTGFEGEVIAAVIGAAAANASNQATAGATATSSTGADNTGDADIDSVSAAAYSGYIDGDVAETYTVEVTQASTGGDLTTATLRILSASGRDDVAEQVPAASGYPTSIGSRGATATFNDNGGDMVVGDVWTVYAREAWTKTVPTAAGTYIGTKDRTYIVEVTTGGISDAEPSDDPYVTVYATDGSDSSGPTRVPTAAATAVAAGQYGATIAFSTAKLRKGDRFEFSATAATAGAYKTLLLAHTLDAAIPEDDDSVDFEISLYIKKNLQLTEQSVHSEGDYNWVQTDAELCIFADAHALDSTWTDDGVEQPLPLIADPIAVGYNKMYVEYQAWLSDISSLEAISDPEDLDDAVPGPLVPENRLKYGLFKALENNNGYPVYYLAVADPNDIASWSDALESIEARDVVYGLVPLTYATDVLALVKAHALAQSGPEDKHYRNLWAGIEPVTTQVMVAETTSSDGEVVLATTEDNPGKSGSQYTLLKITSANAGLIELGVRAKDSLRIRYATDAWGVATYETHLIEEVLTEDSLLLSTGTAAAEGTPIKIEIWRSLTKAEQATANAAVAASYADWRVQAVLADRVGVDGAMIPNYFMCCSLAATVGGVFQHQGLTNMTVAGYSSLGSAGVFRESHRNTMAESGVWLVVADDTGKIYTRHAVTTTADADTLVEREESMRRNFDMICATFDDGWKPQIGASNATNEKLSALRVQFESTKESLRTVITPDLGPYLVDATIIDLRISPVFKDRIILNATLELPPPFNNLDAYFLV